MSSEVSSEAYMGQVGGGESSESLPERLKCGSCGADMEHSSYRRSWRRCARCWNEYHREKNRMLKRDVISVLGGRCLTCGLADWRVLQVVELDGLRGVECGRKNAVFKSLLKYESDRAMYAVLCMNCLFLGRHYGQG